MIDYEVWMELATHMERSGYIPSAGDDPDWAPNGLCHALEDMTLIRIISYSQCDRLQEQLNRKFGYRAYRHNYNGFCWPPGKVAPRIKACKLLAEECKHAPR